MVGLLLLLGGNGLVSLAEQNVASGIAALIIGSVPLWMTTIEALRPGGVRPNSWAFLGLLIGFGGIALLVAPSLFGRQSGCFPPARDLTLLFAALFWSLAPSTVGMRVSPTPPCSPPAWRCWLAASGCT